MTMSVNSFYLQWRRETTSCTFVDSQSNPEWEDGWPSVVVFVAFVWVFMLLMDAAEPE